MIKLTREQKANLKLKKAVARTIVKTTASHLGRMEKRRMYKETLQYFIDRDPAFNVKR